ncbi:hypothetical protein GYMLUDRAFT_46319 [Collybiopsis luxurians FD-317 M1]|uniref:Protein kinase domain-containing protein n=1 Tax=Collybiopsis luxurians FD-317 M1 TaxID=944289 RepID=A0A0D0B2Q7_9AGAR|nr:hypothetical protein GYMLUDRAFT_46319 [Collybiopsis luxurians FD-317 M1]
MTTTKITGSVSLSDFTLLKLLSTGGGASKVYLALDKTCSRHVALKVIPKRELSYKTTPYVLNEQAVQRRLTEKRDQQHHFLPLLTSWHDSECFYLATEYQRGGDMSVELMRCGAFEEDRARLYAAEIFLALQWLHSSKIMHRDIKPSNILFAPDGHLIVCDFGAARQLDDAMQDHHPSPDDSRIQCAMKMTDGNRGTPLFMSPEQHRGEMYSYEVDYWALGVLLFRMLGGKMPFGRDSTDKQEIRRSVLEDPLSFEGFSPSPEAQNLLTRLLAKDPKERISPQQIPRHLFFATVDWTSISSRSSATPWPPFLRFIPSKTRTTLPIKPGMSYKEMDTPDPYPDFFWHLPTDQPHAVQPSPSIRRRKLRKSRSLPLRVFNALSSTSALDHPPSLLATPPTGHSGTPPPLKPLRAQTTLPPFHGYHSDSDHSSASSTLVGDEYNSALPTPITSSLKFCLYSTPEAIEEWRDNESEADAKSNCCGMGAVTVSRYADALTDRETRFSRRRPATPMPVPVPKRDFLKKVKAWIQRDRGSASE